MTGLALRNGTPGSSSVAHASTSGVRSREPDAIFRVVSVV
jgi:hypothetical protein